LGLPIVRLLAVHRLLWVSSGLASFSSRWRRTFHLPTASAVAIARHGSTSPCLTLASVLAGTAAAGLTLTAIAAAGLTLTAIAATGLALTAIAAAGLALTAAVAAVAPISARLSARPPLPLSPFR
jgi:hypothetical protein